MCSIFKSVPSFFLLTGSALLAEPPAVPQPSSAHLLAEALPVLQAKYVDFRALQWKEGDRLGDLIARSNGKISLDTPKTSPAPSPIITAALPGNIVYWRLASFTPQKNWSDLASELQGAIVGGMGGAILDLRSNAAPDDFAGAAQIMNFFAPEDTALQKFVPQPSDSPLVPGVAAADNPPRRHGPLIVLTNNQTAGAAEALAASLQADGALVVGRKTRGRAAVFAEQKLSSGQILRYMIGQVSLANGAPLWDHPVTPDIGLPVNDPDEKAALALIEQQQVMDVIRETAGRHRLSEAALVQGEDPELDDYLAAREKKPEGEPLPVAPPVVRDLVLIRAMDSLKAIDISQRRAAALPETSASVQ